MKSKRIWLAIAFVVFGVICVLPLSGLSMEGRVTLAITALAIILWVSEAVSYVVSSFLIMGLIAIGLGLTPNPNNEGALLGTKAALKLALSGYSSSSLWLVAGGLFLAIAIEQTGLHRRIGIGIMSIVGTTSKRLILGVMIISTVLVLVVPSAAARGGAMVPIVLGIVEVMGQKRESNLAKVLLITAAISISLWNIGIKTGAAQNLLALSFIESAFHYDVSWLQYFIYGAPLSVILHIVMFFLLPILFPIDDTALLAVGNRETLQNNLKQLGRMSAKEKRLILYLLILLFFWSTEGVLHTIDSTSITMIVFAMMIMPKIGVYKWSVVQKATSWSTLITFGMGVSLGTVLLSSGAAEWISFNTLGRLNLQTMPLLVIIGVLSAAGILLHLGFASSTSLAAVFIPLSIGIIGLIDPQTMPYNTSGIAFIQVLTIGFGFILPVNNPQNMLAYGTGAFKTQDLMKAGIPMTFIGYILILVFSATYWQWVGLL